MAKTTSERFWAKVDMSNPDGCWMWMGSLRLGYGQFGRGVAAHRFSYVESVGPIPVGMMLDHTCFNRACVRPEHLRVVTPAENQQHRSGPTRANKSGFRGVYWHKRAQKWAASVRHNGTSVHLGLFKNAAEAGEVARKKRLELFTHNDLDRS